MITWKRSPQDLHVAKYVECYWFLEKEHGDNGSDHPKLNPDPNAHLILAEDNQNYRFTQDEICQKGSGSHWIFPHKKSFTMDHSQPFRILGVKFKVGGLYSLNNITSQANSNSNSNANYQFNLDSVVKVCFSDMIKSDAFDLSTVLSRAAEFPEQACTILDELLLPLLFGPYKKCP
jgi:hypothetical protein